MTAGPMPLRPDERQYFAVCLCDRRFSGIACAICRVSPASEAGMQTVAVSPRA